MVLQANKATVNDVSNVVTNENISPVADTKAVAQLEPCEGCQFLYITPADCSGGIQTYQYDLIDKINSLFQENQTIDVVSLQAEVDDLKAAVKANTAAIELLNKLLLGDKENNVIGIDEIVNGKDGKDGLATLTKPDESGKTPIDALTGTTDPVTGEKTPGLVDLVKPITNPDGTTNPNPLDALTGTVDPVTGEKAPGLIQEFKTLKDKLGLDMNNPLTVEDRISALEDTAPSNCAYTITIPAQTYDVTVGCDGVPALTLL